MSPQEIGDWGNIYGTLRVNRNLSHVHSGRQSIQISHPTPRTHGADIELAVQDTLFVRYYMKFQATFPGSHHTGMVIRGGEAGSLLDNPTGTRPNGTNHFVATFDHLSPMQEWGSAENDNSPGYSYNYLYHMDQVSEYGDILLPIGRENGGGLFDEAFVPRSNFVPERDRWYGFEPMVQVNTPGVKNGRLALWVDGELIADHPHRRFRTVDTIQARVVSLSSNSSRIDPNKTIWYDDIVVATEYIGPMTDSR